MVKIISPTIGKIDTQNIGVARLRLLMLTPNPPTKCPQLMQRNLSLVGFLGGAGHVLQAGWDAVPMVIVFHEVDALAWNSMSDNHGGRLCNGLAKVAGADDGVHIVAVNFNDVPTEGRPFLSQVTQWHNSFGIAVNLNIIAVDNDGQVAQMIFGGPHHTFPNVALVKLAVASEAVHTAAAAIHAQGVGVAGRLA